MKQEDNFQRCGSGENVCNCKSESECGYKDFDDDNEFSACEECGSDSLWESCWQCGGEGGQDGYDLMEEDPLWYGPDDYRECDICEGKGGYYVCLNHKNHAK